MVTALTAQFAVVSTVGGYELRARRNGRNSAKIRIQLLAGRFFMDPSTLAKTIKELETVLNSLGGWLEFWTAVVVIGLVVEYAEPCQRVGRQKTVRLENS
jgi:hypothetical protein